ncbi:hypothetical protein FOFC_16774 [Fusarium oxysporum]|nr:hypothetical protein FOFC_16774 [Fusarium oxysporum]
MWWPSMFASSSSSFPSRESPLACGHPFKANLLFAHPSSVYHDMILVNRQGQTLQSSSSAPHPGIVTEIKGWAVLRVDYRGASGARSKSCKAGPLRVCLVLYRTTHPKGLRSCTC